MKLKLDAAGNVVTKDVNGVKMPVYVHDDGKEVEFNAVEAVAKISSLNAEARGHREAKEAAEAFAKPFKDAGLTDAVAAVKALDTVKSFDGKQALTAADLDRIATERATAAVDAAKKGFEPVTKERDGLKTRLHSEMIGGGFARSKYIADKLNIPVDMVQAKFGSHFVYTEDGRIVAKGHDGKEIYSRSNPGSHATFDEALETLVDGYADKAKILKGTGASGAGSRGGNGNSGAPDLSGLSPTARMTAAREAAGSAQTQ